MANKSGAVLGKTAEKAMELLLPLRPKPPVSPRQKMPMTQPEMEEVTGTYRNGNLRIDLFIRDGKLIRKEFYKTSVEEGPGHEFEVPVAKIGRDRFVFTPPGSGGEDIQFTVIRGEEGKPEFLHGNLEGGGEGNDDGTLMRKQNFMLGIKDKVVVITGASSGIGEAT